MKPLTIAQEFFEATGIVIPDLEYITKCSFIYCKWPVISTTKAMCELHLSICHVCSSRLNSMDIANNRIICCNCKCKFCANRSLADSKYCIAHKCWECDESYVCKKHKCIACGKPGRLVCTEHKCKMCEFSGDLHYYAHDNKVHTVSLVALERLKQLGKPLDTCYSWKDPEKDCSGYDNTYCGLYDIYDRYGKLCQACIDCNMCECTHGIVEPGSNKCQNCNYLHTCPHCSEIVFGELGSVIRCSSAHSFKNCAICNLTLDARLFGDYCIVCYKEIGKLITWRTWPCIKFNESILRRMIYVRTTTTNFKLYFPLVKVEDTFNDHTIDTFLLFVRVCKLPTDLFYKILLMACEP